MKKTGKSLPPAQEKTLIERAAERTQREKTLRVVRTFRPAANPSELQPIAKSISLQEQLNRERVREIHFKYYFRMLASVFFAVLLGAQNLAVFAIIIMSLQHGWLKDLQPIFVTLIGATLTETYFITKIIINFIFSTTDYSVSKKTIVTPQSPTTTQ